MLIRGVAYLALAVVVTWPTAITMGALVPGAERTDLWNSLWSFWYVSQALGDGSVPWETALLGHPGGGVLWPADPLNAILAFPLVMLWGVPTAWSLLVVFHVTASGAAAHALSARLGAGRGAWVAGVGWACAPILLSGLHNGTSEAVGGVWLPLAVLALVEARDRGRFVLGAAALGICAVSSWYAGVCAGFFWLALLAFGPGRRALLLAGLGASLLTAPAAAVSLSASTSADNLVGIKGERETSVVRRTIGAADPRGWVMPGDFRSPDFAVHSRYGERFVHCHYLGFLLIGAAGIVLIRRRRVGFVAVAGAAGLVAAMGPVVVLDGEPVVVRGFALALPWLAVEQLPAVSSLSLLYRLAMAPSLALALLAAHASQRFAPWLALAVLLELRGVAPAAALPEMTDVEPDPALLWLADADDGAVLNFPVVGGRAYLFEQTVHGKPLAATLNFPNNGSGVLVWDAILETRDEPSEARLERVRRVAQPRGIRYVVVHEDPDARPDHHDVAVQLLSEVLEPAARSEHMQVLALW